MAATSNHKMIRVPAALAARIEALQETFLASYEAGRTQRAGFIANVIAYLEN